MLSGVSWRQRAATTAPSRGGTGRRPGAPQGPGGLLLQLQRSHGNQFVQRLMARPAAGMAAAPAVDPGPADRLVRRRQAGSLPSRFSGVLEARAAAAAPDLLFRRGAPSLGRPSVAEQVPGAPLVVGAAHDPAEASTCSSAAVSLTSARRLKPDDVAYLRGGFDDTEEQAFILRAMILERLDGEAREAFREALDEALRGDLTPPG